MKYSPYGKSYHIYHWFKILSLIIDDYEWVKSLWSWRMMEGKWRRHIPIFSSGKDNQGLPWNFVMSNYSRARSQCSKKYFAILSMVKSCSAHFIFLQRIEKNIEKKKRNNRNEKYKCFIFQTSYTHNCNSNRKWTTNLWNELFLYRNRFHFRE